MRAKNLFGDRRGVAQIIGFLIVTTALFGIVTYVLVAKGQQAEMKAQGLIDVMREAEARQREFISLVYAENDGGQIKVYLYNYGTENVRLDENNLFIENTRVSAAHRLAGVAFSWSYSDPDGDPQVKYRVQVSDRSDFGNIIWDTGEVASSDSSCRYGGPGLTEGATYYIRVNLYDGYEWTGWFTGSFVA
jgi:hypothetical protein